jgi:hypothetical protein
MKWLVSDIGKLLTIYVVCIITTYLLPNYVSQIFFLLLLIIFYYSKDNYFWFALVFFLVDPPGGFFPANDYSYGLPMYNLFPGSGRFIYFQELFIFTAFFKALRLKVKPRIIFIKPLILLGFYFLFLFLLSFLIGISTLKILNTIRNVLPWSLIFSISVLISNDENWRKFFRVVFILLIVSITSQIVMILLNQAPAYLLGTDFNPVMSYGELDYSNASLADPSKLRPISSPFISLISLMGAMFFILYKGKSFSKTYLFIILYLAIFSILITATRGWIIAYSIMMILFMVVGGGSIKRFVQITVFLFIAIGLVLLSPRIRMQVENSLTRVETLEKISEGDLTAGGTLSRLDVYSPEVMSKFYENPVLGWGFSDEYAKNTNGHVGNQSLLLNVGVIGFILFSIFWVSICINPFRIIKNLSVLNPYKNGLKVIPIIFVGLFIIHSTSGQQFQYLVGFQNSGFNQMFFFTFVNFYLITAQNYIDPLPEINTI